MSTRRFMPVLLALLLALFGAPMVVSALDVTTDTGTQEHTRIAPVPSSTLPQDGDVQEIWPASADSLEPPKGTPQSCILIDIKGSNGMRATECVIPSGLGKQ